MAKNVNAKTWALEPDAEGYRWSNAGGSENLPPVWAGAPASLNAVPGALVNFYQWASDPNGDALTFSLSQIPTGYSITTAGVLTVGSGSGTVVVRATDPGGLYAETVCSVVVSQPTTGDAHFIIPSSVSTWDASVLQTRATGGQSVPNSIVNCIVELSAGTSWTAATGGTRGALTIKKPTGKPNAKMIVRNPFGAKVTVSAGSGALLTLDTPKSVVLDGSYGTPTAGDGTVCGILVRASNANTYGDQALKCLGYWQDLTIRNIEVDGRISTFDATKLGVGISTNDQSTVWGSSGGSALWKDGLLIENCHVHHVQGEAIYCGGNYAAGVAPQRNCVVRNNWVHDTGRDCLNCKAWWEGDNQVYGNLFERSGLNISSTSPENGQGSGLSFFSARGTVYNNTIIDSGEIGIKFLIGNGPIKNQSTAGVYPAYSEWPIYVYNNLVVNAGVRDAGNTDDGRGISIRMGSPPTNLVPYRPNIYNNTVVDSESAGVFSNDANNAILPGFVRNNVLIGNLVPTDLSGQMSGKDANNKTTGTLTAAYKLTAEDVAVGTIGVDISAFDHDNVSRTPVASKGAYEFA
jgi:hypothetical protein